MSLAAAISVLGTSCVTTFVLWVIWTTSIDQRLYRYVYCFLMTAFMTFVWLVDAGQKFPQLRPLANQLDRISDSPVFLLSLTLGIIVAIVAVIQGRRNVTEEKNQRSQ